MRCTTFILHLFVTMLTILPCTDVAADSDTDKLYNICAANISPKGELSKMFNMGSQYTDLQREEML